MLVGIRSGFGFGFGLLVGIITGFGFGVETGSSKSIKFFISIAKGVVILFIFGGGGKVSNLVKW